MSNTNFTMYADGIFYPQLPRPIGQALTFVDYDTSLTFIDKNIRFPKIKQVIFNDGVKTELGTTVERGATTVYFDDGTKVVVKRSMLDDDNKEHALIYAIVKRVFGKVDPNTGLVDGTGMGGYIQRLLKNAQYQEAKILKAKRPSFLDSKDYTSTSTSTSTSTENDNLCEDCGVEGCPARIVPNKKSVRQQKREEAKLPKRDSKGRFAKKANRKH